MKLYLHESNRVYRDKMVEEKDLVLFDKIQTEVVKKIFDVSIALWIFSTFKNSDSCADYHPNYKNIAHKLRKQEINKGKKKSIIILQRRKVLGQEETNEA